MKKETIKKYSPYKDYGDPEPELKITHKVCTKCGRKKPIEEFHKGTGRGGRAAQCKECCHLYYRKHYHTCESYQKRLKAASAKWAREHPNEIKQRRILYYERRKVVRNRATAELHDTYIIQLLLAQGMTREEITPKIIEIKRQQVADARRYRKVLEVNQESKPTTEE